MFISVWFLVTYFFVLGLIVGSFLNAAEYRLAHGQRISRSKSGKAERSRCPHCHTQLRFGDLLPVVSYALLHGKCRYCKKKISFQYPAVELISGTLFALAAFRFGWSAQALAVAFFGALLLFVFLYDHKHQLILDRVTLPAIPIVFVVSWLLGVVPVASLLLGAALGGGFFLLQFVVSKGKWIGGGDIRLGVLMGVMLGLAGTLTALFLAYVGGALIALGLILTKRLTPKSHIAFGTFLTAATYATLLYGEGLLDWYIGLLT